MKFGVDGVRFLRFAGYFRVLLPISLYLRSLFQDVIVLNTVETVVLEYCDHEIPWDETGKVTTLAQYRKSVMSRQRALATLAMVSTVSKETISSDIMPSARWFLLTLGMCSARIGNYLPLVALS